jgi:hypothetical protein
MTISLEQIARLGPFSRTRCAYGYYHASVDRVMCTRWLRLTNCHELERCPLPKRPLPELEDNPYESKNHIDQMIFDELGDSQ